MLDENQVWKRHVFLCSYARSFVCRYDYNDKCFSFICFTSYLRSRSHNWLKPGAILWPTEEWIHKRSPPKLRISSAQKWIRLLSSCKFYKKKKRYFVAYNNIQNLTIKKIIKRRLLRRKNVNQIWYTFFFASLFFFSFLCFNKRKDILKFKKYNGE